MERFTPEQVVFLKQEWENWDSGSNEATDVIIFKDYLTGYIHGVGGKENDQYLLAKAQRLVKEWELELTVNERDEEVII